MFHHSKPINGHRALTDVIFFNFKLGISDTFHTGLSIELTILPCKKAFDRDGCNPVASSASFSVSVYFPVKDAMEEG